MLPLLSSSNFLQEVHLTPGCFFPYDNSNCFELRLVSTVRRGVSMKSSLSFLNYLACSEEIIYSMNTLLIINQNESVRIKHPF